MGTHAYRNGSAKKLDGRVAIVFFFTPFQNTSLLCPKCIQLNVFKSVSEQLNWLGILFIQINPNYRIHHKTPYHPIVSTDMYVELIVMTVIY